MPVVRLTQCFINNLAPLPGKKRTEWCDKNQPGLYVEARATSLGNGTYYLRFKDVDPNRTTRHMRLGNTDTLSLVEARTKAKEERAKIQLGANPYENKRKKSEELTLSEFVESHFLPFARARNRSWKSDLQRLKQKILPLYGHRKLGSLSRREIIKFHLSLKDEGLAGATCDHFLKLLRRILNLAVEWEFIDRNPISKAKLFNEDNTIEVLLTDQELENLMTVLHTHPNQLLCRLARFLLATGARRGEALKANWSNISLERMLWTIPVTNSKSKKAYSKSLNPVAIEVLRELAPDENNRNGFLFVNPRTKDRLKTVQKGWKSIREAAGLPNLRCHDLRHLHAVLLLDAGVSLYEIKNALNHSTISVTERYASLSPDRLHENSRLVSEKLRSASPKPSPPELKLIKTGS